MSEVSHHCHLEKLIVSTSFCTCSLLLNGLCLYLSFLLNWNVKSKKNSRHIYNTFLEISAPQLALLLFHVTRGHNTGILKQPKKNPCPPAFSVHSPGLFSDLTLLHAVNLIVNSFTTHESMKSLPKAIAFLPILAPSTRCLLQRLPLWFGRVTLQSG